MKTGDTATFLRTQSSDPTLRSLVGMEVMIVRRLHERKKEQGNVEDQTMYRCRTRGLFGARRKIVYFDAREDELEEVGKE